MAAPKGNSFYKFVSSPTGRQRKYTPGKLWKKAVEYFQWVEENPLYELKVFSNGKSKTVPKMRAMTEIAFCEYAGISPDTFSRYKKADAGYQDFCGVAGKIANVIWVQKFEGAAAELFNSNLVCRELGLKETTNVLATVRKVGKDLADEEYV